MPAASGATVAPSEPRTEPHASEPAVPTDERAASPEPEQPSGFASLDVPGFLPAVVWLPKSSEKSRLFVATHGAGGSPEEHCRFWQQILQNSAIILCLRGAEIRRNAPWGFYYPNHIVLERELLASLEAIRGALGSRISDTGAVYAGFSQGASMGALMIVNHARTFQSLILMEGGFAEWSKASARKFAQNGGKRVLFACGGSGCAAKANVSASHLDDASVEARVEHATGAGHTYGGEVEKRVRNALAWVLGG
jgi:predicted esterase